MKDDEERIAESNQEVWEEEKTKERSGIDTDLDKDDSEGSDEVSEQDDSVTGTKIPINHVPVAMKSPSIVTYKIIKQGEKGVYQIVREDGTDIVIVMNRYGHGMDQRIELREGIWKDLKNMLKKPLNSLLTWESMDIYMLIERKYPLSTEICKIMLDKKLQGGKPGEDCYKMLKMMEKQAGIRK
ncbi:hypothetical protein Tco_0658516 [Tanacetum coccineum]